MNRRLKEMLLAFIICVAASCAFGIHRVTGHFPRQHVEQVAVEQFSASLPSSLRRVGAGILAFNPATVPSENRTF